MIPAADVARAAGLTLTRKGTRLWACCPLHREKTPSMCFYPDGRYHCFGCSAHGDAADLYQALHGGTIGEALQAVGKASLPEGGGSRKAAGGSTPGEQLRRKVLAHRDTAWNAACAAYHAANATLALISTRTPRPCGRPSRPASGPPAAWISFRRRPQKSYLQTMRKGRTMDDYEILAATELGKSVLQQPWSKLDARPAPPELDLTLFPPNTRAMIQAVSASTRAPIELAAVCALGASSACAVGRVKLEISGDWVEPGQLFLLGVAPPTAGKSPVFRHMCGPLMEIFDQQEQASRLGNARQLALRDSIEAEKSKAIKSGKRDEAARLAEEIESLPPLDLGRRYVSGDVTPEHLGKLLADNGCRMAQLDDEGQLLDMVCGRFSDLPDLSPWLKGYNGDTLQTCRKGGSYTARNASLAVLSLTQPDVLDQVVNKGRLQGKGFLARFLIVRCEAISDYRESVPVPQAIKAAYLADVQRMAGMGELSLTLSPSAVPVWRAWDKRSREAAQAEWHSLADMGFKVNALPARLAVNLALLEGNVFAVDAELLGRAIRLSEWFAAHLLAIFGDDVLLSREAVAALEAIKRRVRRTKETSIRGITLKNTLRNLSAFKGEPSKLQEDALSELCEFGYLRPALSVDGPGRWYEVHPDLLKGGDCRA